MIILLIANDRYLTSLQQPQKNLETPSLRAPLVTHIILPAFIRNVPAIFKI